MPLEAKPLFRPDVLRTHLGTFSLPDRLEPFAPKLTHWPELLSTRRAPPNPKSIQNLKSNGPLDRPFAGRRMSAVDQAYRYAINLPCDWIVVMWVGHRSVGP